MISRNKERELKSIKKDLSRLKSELQDTMHQANQSVRSGSERMHESLSDFTDTTRDKISYHRQKLKNISGEMAEEIKKRPVLMSAISLAAGLTIAAIIYKCRKKK